MIKKIIFASLVLASVSCFGQGTLTRIQKFCEVGGSKVVTQGINSTNNVQESFPQCQVAVYAHGTSTLAHVFGDNLTTPTPLANPFTGNTNGSFGFYAGPGCYDIVTSGGNTGDQFSQPFTYSDVCVLQGGGVGPTVSCPGALNGSMAAWIDPNNVGCDNQAGTDFVGDVFGQSFRALGPDNGFIGMDGGGTDPILNEAGFVYWVGADVIPNPYANKVPGLQGSVGNALGIISQSGNYNQLGWINFNGFPQVQVNGVNLTNCAGSSCPFFNFVASTNVTLTDSGGGFITVAASPGSGFPQLQVNGVNLANCSGSTCPLQNLVAGSGVTITNTSGGNVSIAASTAQVHGISFTVYNSGGLTAGTSTVSTDYITVPFACTLQAYNLVVDAGTITVKFWKIATGANIPTVANSISTVGVGISAGTAIHSTTLSDFTTTAIAANDIIAMNITAVSGATLVNGVLQCQ